MGIFDILGKAVTAFKKGLGIMKEKEVKTGYVAIGPAAGLGFIKTAAKPVSKVIAAIGKPVISAVAKRPVLAVVGAGVVASGAAPTIIKTLFKAGKVTGEVITGEKALTAETIAEVGKGIGVLAGVGAVGAAVGIIGKKVLEKKAEVVVVPEGIPLIQEKAIGIPGETPITPETAPITKKKRAYKPRRAIKTPSVRQTVKINILNKPSAIGMKITNKRYISQEILA